MKKRVWALYRVSTTKQIGMDDDIPLQEIEVRGMVNRRSDWKLTNELYEKGVSGFKKKLSERDALQVISNAAENNEFDVLAVFAHDRIGRNKDEIPPFVTYLIKICGIEIWSVTEGEMQAKTHVDSLINYIHLWRAEGESRKISERVTPVLRQMNEEGKYTGGAAPFGYELYETGEVHPKYGKHIKDIRINEEEMSVVRLMFDLADTKGWGSMKITSYLNENNYRTRKGKTWSFSTVFRILQNPIYIGRKLYNTFENGTTNRLPRSEWKTQPLNKSLIGVDKEVWDRVNETIEARRLRDRKLDVSVAERGRMLLNGLAFCGYCGKRLICNYGFQKYKKKNGEESRYHQYRYICHDGMTSREEHEIVMFGGKKYEKYVEEAVVDIINSFDFDVLANQTIENRKKMSEQKKQHIKRFEDKLEKARKGLAALNDEVVNVLLGQSKFNQDTLTKAIAKQESDIGELEDLIRSAKEELIELEHDNKHLREMNRTLVNWGERYLNADTDEKKVLLSRIIKKIIFKKNKVEIEFKFHLDSMGISVH